MKLRHLFLFLTLCFILIAGNFAGGSLLALFALLQMNLLLSQHKLSKKSQLWALYLFLYSIPLVLMWGSCLSFLSIYFNEKIWPFFLMSVAINSGLSLIASMFFICSFAVAADAEFKIVLTPARVLEYIKAEKKMFFLASSLIFIFSLVPALSADWKIIFAVMVTHLILHRRRSMLAF